LHEAILSAYETGKADALLAAYRVATYFPGGYLRLGDGGRIAAIVEKPGAGNEPSDLVTLVAHLHCDPLSLLDAIENEYRAPVRTDDHYERAMAALMQQKIFMPVPYQGQWKAIKYPWHVLDAMEYFLGQIQGQTIATNARMADNALVSGPVIIEPNVRMFAGSCIVGPAYIGAGAIIGNNALVRDSMIGRNSVVGYSTEVARTYVGNDVWFHTNYIGDSVIDSNVSFGSGGITANLRLDEQNIRSTVKGQRIDSGRAKLGAIVGSGARMGVNTLLMPGIKVGQGSFVGPGVVMNDDVQDHMQVLIKQELEVHPTRGTVLAGDRERFRSRL
jgi:NDP-sugar pyrophosphorylase family protein